MSLEHALEIAENTRSHFPAGGASFREGFHRTATHNFCFAEEHVAHLDADHVALIFFVVGRRERLRERIAVTNDGDVHGLALAAIDDAHHFFVAGNMFAVNFKDGVAHGKARLFGCRARYRRQANNHAVTRVNANVADTHRNFGASRILGGDNEFFGNNCNRQRFTTAVYRKRNACTETHSDLFTEIIPTLSRLAVDFGDGVARLNASGYRRRIFCDKAHDQVVRSRFFDAHHIKDHQQDKGKHDVDERTRKGNSSTSTHRLRHKITFIGDLPFLKRIRIFTRHRHVTAERDCRNAVLRFTVAELDKFFAETNAERVDLDIIPLCHQEVTELMDGHEKTQADEPENKHQDIAEYRFHCP